MNNDRKDIIDMCYMEAVGNLTEDIILDKDLWYDYVLKLPQHLQVAYTIVIFFEQVINGGFHQYFFNRYGQFAYLTIEHLKLIKAKRVANLLVEAINLVNYEHDNIENFREKICNRKILKLVEFDDKLSDDLEKLDIAYYDIHDELVQLLFNYLKPYEK